MRCMTCGGDGAVGDYDDDDNDDDGNAADDLLG